MHTNPRSWLFVAWIAVAVVLFPAAAFATVQGPPVSKIEQRDLDGNQSPDMAVIHTSFATDRDAVYVFDGAGDMQSASAWRDATDFLNDTWVFDVGDDGSAQLILRFTKDLGLVTALLYDDQDGDGQVAWSHADGLVSILESDTWSLKVVSEGAWYLSDGYPDQNLRFFFAADEEIVTGVVDADRDGVPDYEFWNAVAPQSSAIAPGQPGLWVNKGAARPAVPEDVLFWPFLIAGDWPAIQNKFDSTSFVVVDWEKAAIQGVSIEKDRSGYPIEAGYFVLPLVPLRLGDLNYVNFENPMAYYDLAADRDGWPELHVRMEYYAPLDPRWAFMPSVQARNDIRFSWNQDNSADLIWDYKLALAGRNQVDSTVQLTDLGIETVPYEELPAWIAEQTWAWGTLVVKEGEGYRSSEGIYEWGATYDFQSNASDSSTRVPGSTISLHAYLAGLNLEPPDRLFNSIRSNFRGEFAYLEGHPLLYLSSVDRKLHLKHASHGIWKVGDGAEVRVSDRDDDAYLDEWSFYRGGVLLRQLRQTADHLILWDGEAERIEVKRAKVHPSLFESPPPANHDEWLALGAQLEQHGRDFGPGDFAGMSAQFDGTATEIERATLRDFRVTLQGPRFILEVQPGFSVPVDQEDLARLLPAAGPYVMEYDGVAWSARPATPASLKVGDLQVSSQAGELRAVGWSTAEATIRNDGLEDAHDLSVCATFDGPDEHRVVMTDTLALLPGEGQQRVTWAFAPPAAGLWQLQVAVNWGESEIAPIDGHAGGVLSFLVSETPKPAAAWLVSLGALVPQSVALFLLAAVALAGVAAVAWVKWGGI